MDHTSPFRTVLMAIASLLSLLLIAGFIYVLFSSATLSGSDILRGQLRIPMTEIQQKGVLYSFNKPPLLFIYIYRPTDEDMERLQKMDAHVWDTRFPPSFEKLGFIILERDSTEVGCWANFLSADDQTILQRLKADPNLSDGFSGMEKELFWLGGFFDLCREHSYDLAGRTIRTWEYSWNGRVDEIHNLYSPTVELVNGYIEIMPIPHR